ncbi:WXG100 family type VII secretion target [Streptomyces sp. HNM0574]|uniref:WXG100 family type VII secretion target n=1 Tax=Streptomyces sp. HNM0574 TaxID=2714954 RepID=UPI00146E0A96|nr:WXG100 family type VII secretion target [Streptomyces sp. HNM0574]NLU69684.1 WXG100 family type VII secretion target [Streptomyces sp. HNM0574]
MAGQFRVTEDELRALSTKITEVNGSVQGEVKRLDGVISQIASGWQGQAATAYHRLQQQWNEDARKMNNILNDIKEAVDSTRQNYSATEEQQNQEVSKIMSDFG